MLELELDAQHQPFAFALANYTRKHCALCGCESAGHTPAWGKMSEQQPCVSALNN